MQIFVQGSERKIRTIKVDPDKDTIKNGKQLYEDMTGLLVDKQVWLYSSKVLKDDTTFDDNDIQKDSTIQVIVEIKGGGLSCANMKKENMIEGKSTPAPPEYPEWMSFSKGLNLVCYCKNNACKSMKKTGGKIFIKKSMGGFDLIKYQKEEGFYCPICVEKMEFSSVIFQECAWRISGTTNAGEKIVSKGTIIERHKFVTFKEKDPVEYESLNIVAYEPSPMYSK